MAKKYFLQEADEMDKDAMLTSLDDSLKQDRLNLENDKISLENSKKSLESDKISLNVKKQENVGRNKLKSLGSKASPSSDPNVQSQALTKDIQVYNKQIQDLNKDLKEKEKSIKAKEESIKNTEEYIKEKEEQLKQMQRNENRLIKAKDFKSIVENFGKINLSESDIIDIIVGTQNPVITKAELVENIQNKLIIEANMNDDVKRKFDSGENDYSGILDPEVIKNLADEAFAEVARNIQQKTGKQNVTISDVQELMGNSLMSAAKKEYGYGIDRLEQKAVEMIRKKYNIPKGAVEFQATITGVPAEMLVGRSVSPQEEQELSRRTGVKIGKVNKTGLKMEKGNKEIPQGRTSEQLNPKIKRRRLTNAMSQGSARKSQNLHHLDDELNMSDPSLNRDYANLMAANDASYFLLDDNTIKSQGESGIHAGNSRVQLSREPNGKPKIIAEGMVFPILLHELSKGVLELMSLWSLPEDAEERQYVLDKTDNLESETNDIRLGAKIWEKFVKEIPVENQEVISLTWNYLQNLSDNDFNSIIDGLLANSTDAKNKIKRMAEDAMEELRSEASDETFGLYGDDDGDTEPTNGEEEEEDEVLKGLLNKEKPEQEIEPRPEEGEISLEDMTSSELKDLMKQAIEDEDYEYASEIRDILKNK